MDEIWMSLKHPKIVDGYMLSSHGRIKNSIDDNIKPYEASYHSSNGYDYEKFVLKEEYRNISTVQLFPIDDLLCMTFIPVPDELKGKRVKVNHIDGCNRNNHIDNLEWVEDVEEWVDAVYQIKMKCGRIINIQPNRYKVSSCCRIYDTVNHKLIKQCMDDGYMKAIVCFDGIKGTKNIRIHRLMAQSFNIQGSDDKHNVINHINGIRSINCLKNIEWVSYQGNTQHAFDVGLEINPNGETHPRAKFTNHQRCCIYEIIIALPKVPPSLVTKIIQIRLPDITVDDVKYAKNIIKKRMNINFPILDWKNPKRFTKKEIDMIKSLVFDIFDEYGISDEEIYINKYKFKRLNCCQ